MIPNNFDFEPLFKGKKLQNFHCLSLGDRHGGVAFRPRSVLIYRSQVWIF